MNVLSTVPGAGDVALNKTQALSRCSFQSGRDNRQVTVAGQVATSTACATAGISEAESIEAADRVLFYVAQNLTFERIP